MIDFPSPPLEKVSCTYTYRYSSPPPPPNNISIDKIDIFRSDYKYADNSDSSKTYFNNLY